MRRSVLLCMNGLPPCESFISISVGLAKWWNARLRFLTMLDTRRLLTLCTTSESALEANGELSSLFLHEQQYTAMKSRLSQACQNANLDFDMRGLRGDPFQMLPREARFHELTIISYPYAQQPLKHDEERLLSPADLIKLTHEGVRPLLILREHVQTPRRVLLVYDGTAASLRAIRSFVQRGFFHNSEMRLLSLGRQQFKSDPAWIELCEDCRRLIPNLETGQLSGTIQKSLQAYSEKWEAEMVVAGTTPGQFGLRHFRTDPLCKLLERLPVALYLMS